MWQWFLQRFGKKTAAFLGISVSREDVEPFVLRTARHRSESLLGGLRGRRFMTPLVTLAPDRARRNSLLIMERRSLRPGTVRRAMGALMVA